nr:LCP family protein [Micromonospora sp. DSM 115978]
MPLPPGRRAVRAVLRAASVLTSCLVMFVSVGGWLGYSYIDSKIDRVDLGDLGDRPDEARPGTVNYLLVGTDSRAGAGGAYGAVEGQRSDTTILVHLDEDGTTTMVSFQRDMYVTIPEYTDADGGVHPARKDKFNSAIADGGPTLLIKLVETLTNIRIDHYVSMDLQGFKEITDAIGGVEVCLAASPFVERFTLENGRSVRSSNLDDPSSGFRGQEGVNVLSGEQALAFVRQRRGFADGDLSRIRRQQAFLGAVFRQVTSS